jgi:hypothetical protein
MFDRFVPVKEGWRTMLVCGIVMLVYAVHLFFEARAAEASGGIVPVSLYVTSMSPRQACAASLLTFTGGIVALWLARRGFRQRHARDEHKNI